MQRLLINLCTNIRKLLKRIKDRSAFLGELSKSKKKFKKQKSDESNDEYQITIASFQELNYDIHGNVVKMFGWQK